MRYFVIMVSCLMFLALAGAGAARAAELGGCADLPTAVETGSAIEPDCDMGQNKVHKCDHDACGYHLVAISEGRDFSTPPLPRVVAVASIIKHLTSSERETLLHPPRA